MMDGKDPSWCARETHRNPGTLEICGKGSQPEIARDWI
jgi:hypothetical protein